MGEVWGLSYETPGYQDSRNDSKMGNVFSASFLKFFSGSEDELAKKVFSPKRSKVFSHLDAAAWQSGVDCRSPGE